MEARVAKYLARPTIANARALVRYMAAHMMAEAYANAVEKGVIAEARNRVGR